MADEMLTLTEIASELGLNPSTVRVWVNEKRLPAHKLGRKWVVTRRDLERLLEDEPRLGHPRSGIARPERLEPTDWSLVPEQATLNLAASTRIRRDSR